MLSHRDRQVLVDCGLFQGYKQSAGHLLGSAMILVDDGQRRVLFSGDVGRPHDAIMREPSAPPAPDVLILESTYGDCLHDRADPSVALGEVVRRVAGRGGIIIVPAFSVGRPDVAAAMPELLAGLNDLHQSGPRRRPFAADADQR